MECTAKKCLKALIKNDAEEFDLLLLKIKQLIHKVRKNAGTEIKWIQDIPVFCTLYNNPRFLNKVFMQLKGSYSFTPSTTLGQEVNAIDLANAFGFRKCEKQLMKLYGTSVDGKRDRLHVPDFSIFVAILNIGQIHRMDQNLIIQCFHRLVENGLDICAKGPLNKTILQEAVLKMCTAEMFKCLFSFGFDVNSTDDFGDTAFSTFIWSALRYKGQSEQFTRILLIFLYQNPDTSLDAGLIQQALCYDRTKFPDEEEISDDEGTEVNEGKYVHPNEELRLLPWLYKCGFHITQYVRDTIELPNIFTRSVTYNLSLNNPRSLKESARLAVRAAYPGQRLHKVINSVTLPTSIRDYILMECLNIEPLGVDLIKDPYQIWQCNDVHAHIHF